MHTTEWYGMAPNETLPRGLRKATVSMHHNGDYSGNVKFVLPYDVANAAKIPPGTWANNGSEEITEVSIPFAAVKSLVLDYLRREQIRSLEDMTDDQLEQYFVVQAEQVQA